MLTAVVDALKVFLQAQIQTRIVRLIRNGLKFAGWKERKLAAAELGIFTGPLAN